MMPYWTQTEIASAAWAERLETARVERLARRPAAAGETSRESGGTRTARDAPGTDATGLRV